MIDSYTKRTCPACNENTLLIFNFSFNFSRKNLRTCRNCGRVFRERFRPLILSDLILVCTTAGAMVFFIKFIPKPVAELLGGVLSIGIIAVLSVLIGGVLPAYMINRTVPLASDNKPLDLDEGCVTSDVKPYMLVVLFFIVLAFLSFRSCSILVIESHQDYDARMQASIMAKAQVSEFVSSTTELKWKLFEHHIIGGMPEQPAPLSKFADDYNHNLVSEYVEHIIIYVPDASDNVVIQAKFKSDTGVSEFIRGKTLSLSYVRGKSDSGHWQCGLNSIGVTDIDKYYLPDSCR